MKIKFLLIITVVILSFPKVHFGQAPNLGTAANFVLFTTVGGVSNVGVTHLTGNVGTNSGLSTAFGNVDGQMHDNDGVSAQCAADVLIAYNQLNSTIPNLFPASLLGNGQILTEGVYSIPTPATLNLDLTLDALGDPNAVFIFQIQGSFSTNASAKVHLINGAQACNVFWKVEGLVSMGAGTTMRGTIIANNAAINMSTGDTLEGRALSTAGAITVSGILGYTPSGCGSLVLIGPAAPNLASADCFALFSSDGPVTNVGVTNVTGDIGTNNGSVTGYNPLLVVGAIHAVPDGSTAACAADLGNAYTYLNTLPHNIELLYPAQFGNNLVLTPHTYVMNGAVTFTDSLYLNAEGNSNAVFVIKCYGALSTSVNSKVILLNGAQAKNVYWLVNGAVTINDFSIFRGTIISNNGAISLNTGAIIDGRALTTTGALNTAAVTVILPPGSCGASVSPTITAQPSNQIVCRGSSAVFSVEVTGTGLTYQWRKGLVNLIDGGNISGATTATLTINPANVANAGVNYNVVISSASSTITSVNVSLTINTPPLITSQPSNKIGCLGSAVSFTVAATGTGLTYQWRKGLVNLTNGVNISGVTTKTLTINPVGLTDVALDYNVIISGTCLPDATSNDVSLRIGITPTITSQPSDITVCEGNSATFIVAALGTGLTYQWKKGLVNVMNGATVSGATTATLTINPVSLSDADLNYNVVVSGGCLPTATSVSVSLTVNATPSITSQPSTITACEGSSVTFTVSATGTNLNYQWKKGLVDITDGATISGATTATLTINPVSLSDANLNYNVVVSGACLPAANSVSVSLTVNATPSITSQPSSITACEGSSVTFTVAATGTNLNYQWKKGLVDITDGVTISGATTATLTINPVSLSDANLNYNVVVSGACLPAANSVSVSLTINTSPTITSQPSDITACEGSSVTFTVAATGTNLNYQWRKGLVNLSNSGTISCATTATLTINPVSLSDAATDYNVLISGACLPTATSNNASLIVNAQPIVIANSNSPVCAGSPINLSTSLVSNGTYSWTSSNGYTSSSQNPVIVSSVISDAGTYSLSVSNGTCTSVTSTVSVVVNNCSYDLSVIKTVSNTVPTVGNTIVFTISAKNNSLLNATGVTVIDVLENGYGYVSSSATAGTYDVVTGVWTIGSLNSGSTETLTITVTVLTDGNYVNTATISGNEPDGNMTNNSSTVETFPIDFNIPEGFSPNDDGINDVFVIRGIKRF
ncbi:MAG: DUF3494 domain-containing protein, partial [Bacteroidia bacterium]|nr:DUF3494 domain-containing protein [Bacteroidia bacterium]